MWVGLYGFYVFWGGGGGGGDCPPSHTKISAGHHAQIVTNILVFFCGQGATMAYLKVNQSYTNIALPCTLKIFINYLIAIVFI